MSDLLNEIKPRVLVVSRRESLLGQTVEHLVPDEMEWKVLRTSQEQCLEELLQKLDKESPNIVIISQDDYMNDKQLSLRMLQECTETRKVIMVSMEKNLIEVYSKQKVKVESLQDLFTAVEDHMAEHKPVMTESTK